MGNCQAAEAATVLIVHPGNKKIERMYWSVGANQIMYSNPGHYVAQVVTSPSAKSEDGKPLKHLKLLRPDDTLHIGQVYRLITFEDVLKEFTAKKCVKLGKLLKETGGISSGEKRRDKPATAKKTEVQQEVHQQESESSSSSSSSGGITSSNSGRVGRHPYYQAGQWKPALQSIAEVGS